MNILSVHKKTLLLIAIIVWLAAGVNIARIGLEAYAAGHLTWLIIVLSAVVGIVFWTGIFGKLVVTHTARSTGYEEERQFFLKFFDVPAFAIMAVMMTGGISIRTFGLAPEGFIAVFHFDPRGRRRPRGVHRGFLHRPRVGSDARRPALRLHVATRGPRYPRLTSSHSELSCSVVRDSKATPPS